jgi:hypothetical protein
MRLKSNVAAIGGAIFVLGAASSPLAAQGKPAGDACAFLAQAQVSAVLGVSMGAGQRVVPSSPRECGWAEPGGPTITSKRVVATISTVKAFTIGKTPVTSITKTPVSGIGDDAYYVTAGGLGTTLNVKKGSAAFSISVKGSAFKVDQVKAMEKTLAQDILKKL